MPLTPSIPGQARAGVVLTFARTLDRRSPHLGGRARRVPDICGALADELGVSFAVRGALQAASQLLDIGNAGVPRSILGKASPFSDRDHAAIRAHATFGADLLARAGVLPSVTEIVRAHHERWDGEGYPHGLRGDDIPFGAQILAVADVVDAICSHRPHRAAADAATARAAIIDGRGTRFAPVVVGAFAGMEVT